MVKPSDTLSWFRALKLIDHIGDATVYQILEHLGVEQREFRSARSKAGLFKKLHRFPARAAYKAQLIRLARVFVTMLESKTPSEQLSAVLRFYRPLLKNKYDDVQRRGRDLEHLQSIAKRYKTPAKLLDDIALDPTEAVQDNAPRRSSGFVTLSTVHSAKGLEWDNLFVIWMTDGWFPSSRFQDEFDDFEEERRLLYVATTRAKKELAFRLSGGGCLQGSGDGWHAHALALSRADTAVDSSTRIFVGRIKDNPQITQNLIICVICVICGL